MRVLLVGGGGREHALARAIAASPELETLIAAPGNPGIARHARCQAIADTAIEALLALARRERVDLTVVGPEVPLALGLADRFRSEGLLVFGPSRAAARIESSKAFAKALMAGHRIPTARFAVFTELEAARAYCREVGAPLVVKADGLAAGKGAIICPTLEDADRALHHCLEAAAFGDAGRTVVVEELLLGEEASFFALCVGTDAVPLGSAQDHKAVFDDDQGPNTGGMGAYSPTPALDAAAESRIMADIVRPTLAALDTIGAPFRGVLFVGLMLTKEGPKVIEFNCRFGDPECEVLVPRLADDLLPALAAVAAGDRVPPAPRLRPDASVCVVMASGGYPGRYTTGLPITGTDEAEAIDGVTVFHAGTAERGGQLVTAGGRVLAVQALGSNLETALGRCYRAVGRIGFEGAHHRTDIGRRALGHQ